MGRNIEILGTLYWLQALFILLFIFWQGARGSRVWVLCLEPGLKGGGVEAQLQDSRNEGKGEVKQGRMKADARWCLPRWPELWNSKQPPAQSQGMISKRLQHLRTTAPQNNHQRKRAQGTYLVFLPCSKFSPWGSNSQAFPGCVPGLLGWPQRKPDVMPYSVSL